MLNQDILQSLTQVIDKRQLINDPAEMIVYESDATSERGKPDLVVFPKSTEEISRIVRWAAEHHVPIVARGAGTGLSGGAVAEHGGIIIEFSNFNRVLELDTAGRSVVTQVGVINQSLDTLVKTQDLYFPPDPASGRSATIGGNVAENAGGPHCFKYGVTSNYVTGLQVVLADGRIVHLGGRAFDYPECDLVGLMTGSEGTLGIITEMDARLVRNPPDVKTMMASFDNVEAAGRAVSAAIAAGLVPATMEMLDQSCMRIVEDYLHLGLPVHAGAMLIVEVDGYPAGLDAQMNEMSAVLERNGAHDLRVAKTAEERDQIWYGRKSTAGAFARIAPEKFTIDCTVPRSQIADMLRATNEICLGLELSVGYILHAGDGNIHTNIPFFPSDKKQVARGWQACEAIVRAAVARDGTITGEHGVGIEKREWMAYMCDGAELSAMWDIKQVFDPGNLLNPGKIFPSKMSEVNRVKPMDASRVPSGVFTPTTAQEAAAGLVALANVKEKVSIVGRPPERSEAKSKDAVTLSTKALNKIIQYAPDDLYITVGAGMTLDEIQSFLAKDGWQMPLVSPWREMTIGGIVATNLNSPQRMRYGSVRDVMLCAHVALTDGRLVRAGRVVVKNVAGYDLPKVLVGSHGTLGLLTDVTLKLVGVPRAKQTLVVPVNDLKQGLEWGSRLVQIALTASAIVVTKGIAIPGISGSLALAYTAEGFPLDVESEINQVRDLLTRANAPKPIQVESTTGTDLWSGLLGTAKPESMIIRAGVAPKDVVSFAWNMMQIVLSSEARNLGIANSRDFSSQKSLLEMTQTESLPFLVDVANGLVYVVASSQDVNTAKTWLDALRNPALAAGGYATVMQMPEGWRGTIDRWGYRPDTLDLMRALKAKWDPADVLDRDEFIGPLA